ncbi:ferredoxin [Streptomyces sp. NBC_00439]|uniref:4Fe-4S domain-containing protein n=1 Tax=Streptomyces sp. NBC_00439 TaxID=2903650 RepID=UPI002B1E5434|nr:ferredoxin [Streptomyces sp. NBC_00439]
MSTISAPGTDAPPAKVPDCPMTRAADCPFDPPPTLHTLQAQDPISRVRLWDGSTPWLVTRYDDMRALLSDPRISSDSTNPHYAQQSPASSERRRQSRSFITMDDPEHARLRRMATAAVSIKHVEALRPVIQKIVDGLIEAMLAGPNPVDLVQAFALPMPSLMVCRLLGVPYADHDFFQSNSKMLIKRTTTPEQARAAHPGQCALTTPEVFDQREEDGIVVLLTENPPERLADEVRQAAALCPAQAIWVEEEEKKE